MSDQAEQIYERLLVVRAQGGDEAAFVELVDRYSPRLRYFLRKLLEPNVNGDRSHGGEGVEDALQGVWLAVWRQLPRLADPQALRAWLYRISRDQAFARLRNSRSDNLALDEATLPASGLEDEAQFSAEDAAQIHAALGNLPPLQREALVLRFLEDMTYEQIAAVVGCQVGTVRSRIHYGKQALRRLLANAEQA